MEEGSQPKIMSLLEGEILMLAGTTPIQTAVYTATLIQMGLPVDTSAKAHFHN